MYHYGNKAVSSDFWEIGHGLCKYQHNHLPAESGHTATSRESFAPDMYTCSRKIFHAVCRNNLTLPIRFFCSKFAPNMIYGTERLLINSIERRFQSSRPFFSLSFSGRNTQWNQFTRVNECDTISPFFLSFFLSLSFYPFKHPVEWDESLQRRDLVQSLKPEGACIQRTCTVLCEYT